MYKLKTLVVISTLIAVLAGVSATMLAQNKEPDKPTDRNSASPGANGNILWQYNTHG